MLNALYNQVDEEVHKLVILSNKSQKDLESLLDLRKFEEQTQQVTLMFDFRLITVSCSADIQRRFCSIIYQMASLSFLDQTLVQRRGREAAHTFRGVNSFCCQNKGEERELGTVSGGVSGKVVLQYITSFTRLCNNENSQM